MKRFLIRHSLHFTTAVGLGVLVYLIARWPVLPGLQRLVCFMFLAITAHEWEEKLFGFNDLNAKNLQVATDAVDNSIGHFALFLVTLYVGLVPLFFPHTTWLSATAMVLGFLEMFAHIAAIRMARNTGSDKKGVYAAGMITAFSVLPLLSVYGFYYIISRRMMAPIHWLFALLNLFVPLLLAQFISVKSMGVDYRQFLKNALSSIKG